MAKAEFTSPQVVKAKEYLTNLYKSDQDPSTTIQLEEVGLFLHPYEPNKIFIKYTYHYADKDEQKIVEVVNVCVDRLGQIQDCFTGGVNFRERLQFESDLVPLKLEDNEITMV